MKQAVVGAIVFLTLWGALKLFVVDAGLVPGPPRPVELAYQPATLANPNTPHSTSVLSPTVYLPFIHFRAPDPDNEPLTVEFSSRSYGIQEGVGAATVTAILSAPPDVTVTVDYATSDGTAQAGSDYVEISGTLSFAPGETVQAFEVTINDDPFDEPDETINLTIRNAVNAMLTPPYRATLTIADDEGLPSLQFNSSSYSVHEGVGTATITATLSITPEAAVTVDYATSDGTARAGIDHAADSGKLTFAPGETSQTINLEIFNDPFDEPDETLTIALSNPHHATLGTPASALLTILDEDLPSHFGMQISALSEFSPDLLAAGNGASMNPQGEAEWLALLETAYVTLTAALNDSGAGWARVYLDYELIETQEPVPGQPPEYRWAGYDTQLRLVAEAGVRLVATVADAPTWAADEPCGPIYPDRLDEFTRFLTDLVNRYKGPPYFIRHWELLNEPDYDGSEGPDRGWSCWGNDADRYVQMLAVAYPAIKAADPEATVLMGGLAYDGFTEYGGPFRRYFPDEVMQNGGAAYLDALNFHYFRAFHPEWERWVPGGDPPTCGIVDDNVGTSYEAWGIDVIAKTNHFRNRMKTCFGVDKPIWITELAHNGYPGNPSSLTKQARYVIKGNVRALAAGAQQVTWYALATPNDPWELDLLYDNWEPKPGFYSYQTLISELQGYEFARTLDVQYGEVYVFQDAGGQEKTVAWGDSTLTFAPAGQLRVVDRQGNETSVVDGGPEDADGTQNGAVALQLSAEPVFVAVAPPALSGLTD